MDPLENTVIGFVSKRSDIKFLRRYTAGRAKILCRWHKRQLNRAHRRNAKLALSGARQHAGIYRGWVS